MGVKGPIPQRSDQTVRRNLPETPIDKIPWNGQVVVPPLDIPNAHPIVTKLYQSMQDSAQSTYYQASDWTYAQLTLMFLNDYLSQTKPSAMMIASLDSMLAKLLLTEGDRRRNRIEVEKSQEGAKVLDIAEMFRKKLEQG